jgi:hypothetical protein
MELPILQRPSPSARRGPRKIALEAVAMLLTESWLVFLSLANSRASAARPRRVVITVKTRAKKPDRRAGAAKGKTIRAEGRAYSPRFGMNFHV